MVTGLAAPRAARRARPLSRPSRAYRLAGRWCSARSCRSASARSAARVLRSSLLPDDQELHAGSAYCAASEVPALARSTSNSTTTSSLSLSAPKKPLYGLIPKADCGTVTEPRYRPSPGEFTCSRTGCVWPLKVSEPSTAPPLAPKRTARDEVKRSEEHTSELQSLRHLVCR